MNYNFLVPFLPLSKNDIILKIKLIIFQYNNIIVVQGLILVQDFFTYLIIKFYI